MLNTASAIGVLRAITVVGILVYAVLHRSPPGDGDDGSFIDYDDDGECSDE